MVLECGRLPVAPTPLVLFGITGRWCGILYGFTVNGGCGFKIKMLIMMPCLRNIDLF